MGLGAGLGRPPPGGGLLTDDLWALQGLERAERETAQRSGGTGGSSGGDREQLKPSGTTVTICGGKAVMDHLHDSARKLAS